MGVVKISKISYREEEKEVDYASPEFVIGSLHALEVEKRIPVFDLLKILCKKSIDSVSCDHGDPYCRFFAFKNKDFISIKIVETGKPNIQFEIPIEALEYREHTS